MGFTSGVVATVSDDFGTVEDDHITEEMGEDELECYIEIQEENQDLSGDVVSQEGLIAARRVVEEEQVQIDGGDIEVSKERFTKWDWSRFWVVPNEFIVAASVSDSFPFDKLTESLGIPVQQAKFNLSNIVSDHPGHWMGGFEDRDERVRAGTLWGDEIERDIDMGEAFVSSDKNQIGPIIEFDGTEVRARVTKDGFVQVVSPDYNMEKYLAFLEDMLIDYTY